MNDLIRRQDAIDLLKFWADGYNYIEVETAIALKRFEELPSVTVERDPKEQELCRCRTCRYFGWNRDSDESCDYWDGCATEPDGFCHKWVHK